MADVKISQLPEATSLSPSDVLPSVASSVTSKITVQNLAGTLPQVSSSVSASYALTASYALNGGGGSTPPFPYTGSALITGSLTVTGSVSSTGGFTGSLFGTSSFATTASYTITASVANYSRIQESQYRFQNITVIDQDVWLNSGSIVKVVTSSGVSTAEYSINGGSYTAFSFTGDTWTGSIPVVPKDTLAWRITYRSGFTTGALVVVSNIILN